MRHKKGATTKFEHEVAISYAGEDRETAREIAEALRQKGLSVFYDRFYESDLWGKRLSTWFRGKYGRSSLFVLVLISRHYPVKDWANFEFSTAKAEEDRRKREFILPVRLDKTPMVGLPSDKAYLDFVEYGVAGIADCLLAKVRKAIPGKKPEEFFIEAYQEWRTTDFLPGETKVRYLLDNLGSLPLDVSTCEFLLRSLTGYYQDLKDKLGTLDRLLLFNASTRMLDGKETLPTRWRGIKYAVFADPKQAESYLWSIYRDQNENIEIRTEAFERLWKCRSKRGLDESYAVASKERQWQLRRAALNNIGHGKVRNETPKLLAQALNDKRREVRSEAAYAIVRLNLDGLVPDLCDALEKERSRKCANQLLYCLWKFKAHPKVKYFVKKHSVPNWFHKTPDYHEIWTDVMDETL
jgi:hypothetical protein